MCDSHLAGWKVMYPFLKVLAGTCQRGRKSVLIQVKLVQGLLLAGQLKGLEQQNLKLAGFVLGDSWSASLYFGCSTGFAEQLGCVHSPGPLLASSRQQAQSRQRPSQRAASNLAFGNQRKSTTSEEATTHTSGFERCWSLAVTEEAVALTRGR